MVIRGFYTITPKPTEVLCRHSPEFATQAIFQFPPKGWFIQNQGHLRVKKPKKGIFHPTKATFPIPTPPPPEPLLTSEFKRQRQGPPNTQSHPFPGFFRSPDPEAANTWQEPCPLIATAQPTLALNLPIHQPVLDRLPQAECRIPIHLVFGCLAAARGPSNPVGSPLDSADAVHRASLWSLCVGGSGPGAAAFGSPGGGLVGGSRGVG